MGNPGSAPVFRSFDDLLFLEKKLWTSSIPSTKSNRSYQDNRVFPKWFQWIQWQKNQESKQFHWVISRVVDKHLYVQNFKISLNSCIIDFIRFAEFIQFSEFPLRFGETPVLIRKSTNGLEDLWLFLVARVGIGDQIGTTIELFFLKLSGHWYPGSGLPMMSALGLKARMDPSHACNGFLRFTITVYKHWWGLSLGLSILLSHSVRPARRSTEWAMPAGLSSRTLVISDVPFSSDHSSARQMIHISDVHRRWFNVSRSTNQRFPRSQETLCSVARLWETLFLIWQWFVTRHEVPVSKISFSAQNSKKV